MVGGALSQPQTARGALRAWIVAIATVTLTLTLVAVLHPAAARAATPQALILGSTTVADPSSATGESFEQEQAIADGFDVTVVTDAQWEAMTAAQFRAYQVLIVGDPSCAGDDGSLDFTPALDNDSVWEPVVMSSGGNKVVIGTDPIYHYQTGHSGAITLVKQGIAFAGAVTGATGIYLDMSCSYTGVTPGTPVPILDGLSTHGAGQFTTTGVPCAGAIAVVAASGPTTGLTDSDLSDWECSVHNAFDKFPSDYTPLALATDSSLPQIYCATDVTTSTPACGSPYILVSGSGVTISSDITLAPPPSTIAAGGSVTLTATVASSGSPEANVAVSFSVDSGPNTGKTGSGTTNSSGQTTFTYPDTGGAGTDSVSATFVTGGATEKATASVIWGGSGGPHATSLVYTGPTTGTYLAPEKLSAKLTDTSTSPATPLGSKLVTFTIGSGSGAVTCSGTTTSAGVASCTVTPPFPPGSYPLSAAFAGDSGYKASSATATFVITKAPTTTTVTAAPASPSTFGQSVKFTAAVTPQAPATGTPTGSVAFAIDGTAVGTVALTSGSASISTASLSAGSHTIGATYGGDVDFLGSSGSLPYTVTCAVTITGSHPAAVIIKTNACIVNAKVGGAVILDKGASVDVENSTLSGSLDAGTTPGAIRVCASSISGSVTVKNAGGLVIVGDPGDANCAANSIVGSLLLTDNSNGLEAIDNTVVGTIQITGNSGSGPFPGDPTTVSGNHH
jgi:hypothetical protein